MDAIDLAEKSDVEDVIDYVLADKNCKLKIKAINGSYHHFNSIEEFHTVVTKLQMMRMPSAFHDAEKNDDLFY